MHRQGSFANDALIRKLEEKICVCAIAGKAQEMLQKMKLQINCMTNKGIAAHIADGVVGWAVGAVRPSADDDDVRQPSEESQLFTRTLGSLGL